MTQEPHKNNIILIVIAIIGVIGTIIGAIINVNGNYNVEKFRQESELTRIALVSIATQGGATQVSMASTISAPTSTPNPSNVPQPTFTSYPTYTPFPLPTIQPTASIILPFEDNFDSGLNVNWKTVTGTWRTVNGQLIADPSDKYATILIGDKSWANYTIDVEVYKPGFSNSGWPIGIIVRANNGNYLLYQWNCCSVDWIIVSGTSRNTIAHLDQGINTFNGSQGMAKFHMHVEVNGQTYTGSVDEKLYLTVTDPTLVNGLVGITVKYPDADTFRFDNLVISP